MRVGMSVFVGQIWESKSTGRSCVVIGEDPDEGDRWWVKQPHSGAVFGIKGDHLREVYRFLGHRKDHYPDDAEEGSARKELALLHAAAGAQELENLARTLGVSREPAEDDVGPDPSHKTLLRRCWGKATQLVAQLEIAEPALAIHRRCYDCTAGCLSAIEAGGCAVSCLNCDNQQLQDQLALEAERNYKLEQEIELLRADVQKWAQRESAAISREQRLAHALAQARAGTSHEDVTEKKLEAVNGALRDALSSLSACEAELDAVKRAYHGVDRVPAPAGWPAARRRLCERCGRPSALEMDLTYANKVEDEGGEVYDEWLCWAEWNGSDICTEDTDAAKLRRMEQVLGLGRGTSPKSAPDSGFSPVRNLIEAVQRAQPFLQSLIRGKTHWEGCHSEHDVCSLLRALKGVEGTDGHDV